MPDSPRREVGETPFILQKLVPFVGKGLKEVQVQPNRVRGDLRRQRETSILVHLRTA